MSDTEIEAMAVSAGLIPEPGKFHFGRVKAFAELVRAAERERCAKVCRVIADQYRERGGHAAERAENAIRALK